MGAGPHLAFGTLIDQSLIKPSWSGVRFAALTLLSFGGIRGFFSCDDLGNKLSPLLPARRCAVLAALIVCGSRTNSAPSSLWHARQLL